MRAQFAICLTSLNLNTRIICTTTHTATKWKQEKKRAFYLIRPPKYLSIKIYVHFMIMAPVLFGLYVSFDLCWQKVVFL
jgi:hypothetical protein